MLYEVITAQVIDSLDFIAVCITNNERSIFIELCLARIHHDQIRAALRSLFDTQIPDRRFFRITSYNVCYTKLLRVNERCAPDIVSFHHQVSTPDAQR